MKEGFGRLKTVVSSSYFKAGVFLGSQVLVVNHLRDEHEKQERAMQKIRAQNALAYGMLPISAEEKTLVTQALVAQPQEVAVTTSMESAKSEKNTNDKGIVRNLVPSMVAGTFIAYSTFPLEGLKKYLQRRAYEQGEKFKPYRGSLVFALNIVPTTTIQFFVDGALKTYFPDNDSVLGSIAKSMLCGVVGASTATFVENTIVRQQQMKSGLYPAVKSMFQESPLRPWKTFPHIALRDGIFTCCMLLAMPEAVKYTTEKYGSMYELPTRLAVSALGAALSHPVDTVATLCQESAKKEGLGLHVAKELFKNEGVKAFYRGFPYRLGLFGVFSYGLPKIREMVDEKLFAQNSSVSHRK